MHTRLIAVLQNNMGKPMTPDLASFICKIADEFPLVMPREMIDKVLPAKYGDFVFATEKIEEIIDEIKVLHQEHWKETEVHRHNLELKADYKYFIASEKAGGYVLFTIRKHGKLVGNCAMYLVHSKHTENLEATEDTLYLLPEARVGLVAKSFIKYWENALKQLGVKEINVSVKCMNKAGRFFRILGYRHTSDGLSKMLEVA